MKNYKKGSTATSIILIIILLLVMGFAIYYYSNNSNWFKQQTSNLQQPQKQAPVPTQTIVKKIGDSFVLWNIEYQVISAKNFSPVYDFQKTTGKYNVGR